jgi:hypothetical protein
MDSSSAKRRYDTARFPSELKLIMDYISMSLKDALCATLSIDGGDMRLFYLCGGVVKGSSMEKELFESALIS